MRRQEACARGRRRWDIQVSEALAAPAVSAWLRHWPWQRHQELAAFIHYELISWLSWHRRDLPALKPSQPLRSWPGCAIGHGSTNCSFCHGSQLLVFQGNACKRGTALGELVGSRTPLRAVGAVNAVLCSEVLGAVLSRRLPPASSGSSHSLGGVFFKELVAVTFEPI